MRVSGGGGGTQRIYASPPATADREHLERVVDKAERLKERVREKQLGANVSLPENACAEIGLGRNLAEGTFHAPRTAQEIADVCKKFMADGTIVQSIYMSAQDLDMIHPGSVDFAHHLHPTQPGLMTRSNEDRKKVRVIWRYLPPKSGEIHPEKFALTDGSLAAAWLTADEDRSLLKEFDTYTARCTDRLSGNEHALEKSMLKRIWYGVLYRFSSYGRGLKEGFAGPRFNGMIGANFIINGLPITALLTAGIYGLDYIITKHEMAEQDQALAAGSLAAPPLSTSTDGSYSLNG